MPVFSKTSIQKLNTVHPDLQKVCYEVIRHFDFTVLDGRRDEVAQNRAFDSGASKLKYPQSKHNLIPSLAVDIAPYPLDWEDTKMFYLLGGLMMGTAHQMGVHLRWGGAWDGLENVQDNRFNDLVHFEIMKISPKLG